MSPLIALLIYGDSDALADLQAVSEKGLSVETSTRDGIDRPKLWKFLKKSLGQKEERLERGVLVSRFQTRGLAGLLREAADPLYQLLAGETLVATGIKSGQHRRSMIPAKDWVELTLDVGAGTAGVNSSARYRDVEIRHPDFRLPGKSPKRGPNTSLVDAAVAVILERRRSLPDLNKATQVCRFIFDEVKQRAGREYEFDSLTTKYSEIKRKLDLVKK